MFSDIDFSHTFHFSFFFFNDTPTTEIYTLSLHDALPISGGEGPARPRDGDRAVVLHQQPAPRARPRRLEHRGRPDRKSTRLNSSHPSISYAVFCLKKKKKKKNTDS